MKGKLLALLTIIISTTISWAVVEGIYAMSRSDKLQTSLSWEIYHWLQDRFIPDSGPDARNLHSYTITGSRAFDELLDQFEADGVALGNSYYEQLRTERASMNSEIDGCKVQKPHLDKEMTFLRAGLYEPFAPVSAFYDYDAPLHEDVRAFLDRYGTRRIRHRTNENGERLTLPLVQSDARVIVAGDSVANGANVSDHETLASRLQARDPQRQYVNIGIGGADTPDILCALDRAADQYPGQITELVYVYCENDFKDDRDGGTPEEAIGWLREYVKQNGIRKTTIIYAPYIYNIVPHLTRFRGGYRGGSYATDNEERNRLEDLATEAGFRYVDMTDLAMAEIESTRTQLGALSLFIDHIHWSPVGTERLADYLTSRQ